MSNRKTVGWVISHTGKRGGPWEARVAADDGTPTSDPRERVVCPVDLRPYVDAHLKRIQAIHPAARVLRLVRRERAKVEAPVDETPLRTGLIGLIDEHQIAGDCDGSTHIVSAFELNGLLANVPGTSAEKRRRALRDAVVEAAKAHVDRVRQLRPVASIAHPAHNATFQALDDGVRALRAHEKGKP